MGTDISLFWLTLPGMGSTVVICALIIGLARLVQVFFKGKNSDGSVSDEQDPPFAVIVSAAARAMHEDASARFHPGGVHDSAWASSVRLECSRFEGGLAGPEDRA